MTPTIKEKSPHLSPPTGAPPSLGWQGITVFLPEDWAFSAYSGDWTSGYLRAEGPEEVVLEVKWNEQKGVTHLRRILKDYSRRMHKIARRSSKEVQIKEKPKALQGLRKSGVVPITFSWASEQNAYGALWHCPQCDRIVLAQVVGALSPEKLGPLAYKILHSLQDHPEGELVWWSVYGFAFQVPKSYKLNKADLRSGYQSLEFTNGYRQLWLDRWGLAEVILRNTSLKEWWPRILQKRLKSFRWVLEDREVKKDKGLLVLGQKRGLRSWGRLVQHLLRRPGKDYLLGYGWHCPSGNRIYSVVSLGMQEESRLCVERILESLRCH